MVSQILTHTHTIVFSLDQSLGIWIGAEGQLSPTISNVDVLFFVP